MKATIALVLVSLLCACRSNPAPEFDLAVPCYPIENPVSNEIFLPLSRPIVYVNRRPELSNTGGNFLHVMPLQVSHNGYQMLYLWVGLASTIDYSLTRAASTDDTYPSALVLNIHPADHSADDLLLPLVQWHSGGALNDLVDMPLINSVRTGLTHPQLRALASSEDKGLQLIWPSGRRDVYELVPGERNGWSWDGCHVQSRNA